MTLAVNVELVGELLGLLRLAQVVDHVVLDLGARLDLAQKIHKRRNVHLKKTKNCAQL